MTDGIIQKVFKKHNEIRGYNFIPVTHFGLDNLFDNLEKELIEAIKSQQFDTDKYFDDTIKEVLIGDNEK